MNKEELEQKIDSLLQKVASHSTNVNINELIEMSSLPDDIRSLHEAVIGLRHLNAETPASATAEKPAEEVTAQTEADIEIQDTANEAAAIEEEHATHIEETIKEKETEDMREAIHETSEPKSEPVSELSTTDEAPQEPDQSINDQIESQSEANSVARQLERQPIDNLIQAIGVNEKFLFTKELFNNDAQAYLNAIEKLNGFNTLDEAREYIDTELKPAYDWEDESEAANALNNLIEKRHSS